MATKVTRWSPDTCGCVVEYTWDDAIPEDARAHLYEGHVRKCSRHNTITGEPAYAVVQEENTRKNRSMTILADNIPEVVQETPAGKRLSSEPVWAYNADGVLEIVFLIPISAASKDRARLVLDTEFGLGEVRLL